MKRLFWIIPLIAAMVLCGVAVYQHFSHPSIAAQDPAKEYQATQRAHQFLSQGSVTPDSSTSAPIPTGQSPALGGPVNQATVSTVVPGQIFAVLTIPSLGIEYPVSEGVDMGLLATSVGHYPGTAMPGQVGNVGLPGHDCCREHGSPFANLSQIKAGQLIVLTTSTAVYTYVVVTMPACGSDTPQIVDYRRTDVLNSEPCQPAGRGRKLLTLTTCTPGGPNPTPWRLIVWGELTSEVVR